SGVDVDYDKAIGYATGNYCWLLTDDDLLRPGALSRVFALLDGTRDLIIANGEIKNADLSKVLARRALGFENDREYRVGEAGRLFSEIDRKSTRLNSSHQIISYAVFCLKKKKIKKKYKNNNIY